jgi:putative ABC transport system permease protein
MRWLRESWRRIRTMADRDVLERGLDAEVQFHIEQQTAKNLRAGMTADEARRQALLTFGGAEPVKERARDEFRPALIEDTVRDIRYGFRSLLRSPGFTVVASATIALGIGAATAIFTIVHGVLIKPLPYPNAHELVDLAQRATGVDATDELEVSAAQYLTYREENRSFQQMGLYGLGSAAVTGDGEPEQVRALTVTHGTLDALAVPPLTGRWFTPDDDRPRTPLTAILSYGYWQSRFGGDRSVVGRGITIDGRARQVIGVMPREFRFLDERVDVILPFRFDRAQAILGQFNFNGIARLRPGVSVEQANADVTRMIPIFLKSWPAPRGFDVRFFHNIGLTAASKPLKQQVVGDMSRALWVLMGTIALVLIIACANVANLLLVRTEARQQELAVRAAIGAGWSRIARELMAESVVLALAGGAFGAMLAIGAVRVLVAAGPESLPRLADIRVDSVVMIFACAISLLSGLMFGAIPVLRHARPSINRSLRASGRTSSDSRERHRTRSALVVVQVALAMVLLVASGLMIRTFVAMRQVEPGFTNADRLQLVTLAIPGAQVRESDRVFQMHTEIRDRLAAIPGVTAAAFTSAVPLDATGNSHDVVRVEHRVYHTDQIPPVLRFKFISPGYFDTVGIRLIAGRDVTWDDLHSRRPVVVVSETFAREHWQEPALALGKRIRESSKTWREIVGVVVEVRDSGIDQPSPSIAYWPAIMSDFWGNDLYVNRRMTFVVRSDRTGTDGFLNELRAAIWSVNANLPLAQVGTLDDLYERSLARTSFTLVMLGIAGGMALVLGIVGIYGVIAYAVSQRIREIGIRAALGAQPAALRRMFVRSALTLAGLGLVCGIAGAVSLTHLMKALLFGISPLDPATYLTVAVILASAAVLASYLPAHRATTVDPVTALRSS